MASFGSRPRTPEPAARLAHRLLARYVSAPEQSARPEDGWSNEVWIGQTAVVRIGQFVDGSLAREASLATLLPPDVGYPTVLEQGVTEGLEWMVTGRLLGSNLESVWSTLDLSTRVEAVTDLWARLEAVHRTDVAAARRIGCSATPFYALDETDARLLLDWLAHTTRLSRH